MFSHIENVLILGESGSVGASIFDALAPIYDHKGEMLECLVKSCEDSQVK